MTSFVSANPAPPDTLTVQGVQAGWLQNAGAGIGMVAAVIALRLLWHAIAVGVGLTPNVFPADWAVTLAVAAGLALLLFGVLMVLRSSLDEIVEAGEWAALLADMEQLEQTNATLNETIDALRHQLADTKAELSQQLSQRSSHAFVAAAAAADAGRQLPDARTLVERIYRGQNWNRETMQAAGWTQAKWSAAKETLLAAGVIHYAGRNPQRRTATWAEATAALDDYAVRLQKASLTMNNDTTPEVATNINDAAGRGEG